MIRKLLNISIAALIIATATFVAVAQNQQNRGGNGPSGPPTGGCQINIVTLTGTVESVNMGIRQKYPSFILAQDNGSKTTVLTGPYYILLENKFAIDIGNRMEVQAFPSLQFANSYVAVTLHNVTNDTTLTLRDENGLPVWTRGGGPAGKAGRARCFLNQPPYFDPSAIASFKGEVGSVSMGIGQGYPSFTLTNKVDGRVVTIITGPYYLLVENDFEISTGDNMSVTAFPSLRFKDTYVAVELKNDDTSAVLTLRDENGLPLWGPGPGRGRGLCF
jgi:hypothetical protein